MNQEAGGKRETPLLKRNVLFWRDKKVSEEPTKKKNFFFAFFLSRKSRLTNDNSGVDFIAIFSHSESFGIVFGSSYTRHKSSWWGLDVETPLQVDSRGGICQTGIIIAHWRHLDLSTFSLANVFETDLTFFYSLKCSVLLLLLLFECWTESSCDFPKNLWNSSFFSDWF